MIGSLLNTIITVENLKIGIWISLALCLGMIVLYIGGMIYRNKNFSRHKTIRYQNKEMVKMFSTMNYITMHDDQFFILKEKRK